MIGKQISAEELHALLVQGLTDSVILDVRTPDEFSRGAIEGAINIPLDQLAENMEQLIPFKTIYVYCLSGGRSQVAMAQLSANTEIKGELFNLVSGVLGWRNMRYPLK